MLRRATIACFLFSVVYAASPLEAQVFDEKFEHWPVDLKVKGRIVVASDLDDVSVLKDTVNKSAERVLMFADRNVLERHVMAIETLFPDKSLDVGVLGGDPSKAKKLDKYDVVIFRCEQNLSTKTREFLKSSRDAFQRFLNDDKQLILLGGAAELVSEFYFDIDGQTESAGINLMPDCVIETGFKDTTKQRRRLLSVLALHPRCVGIGLAPQTALELSGRKMRILGAGTAKFFLTANEHQPLRIKTIQAGRSRDPEKFLIDLTQWRRDAIDRTIAPFPPATPKKPFVENGTLIIVGGGGMPNGLMDQMVELAGGNENARMVYIPCSESDAVSETQRTVEGWKKMGVKHATFIHTKDRNKANSDEEFLGPLKDATGLWFGGGRQWNFADSYYGTEAHKLMKDVLKRGGVIGGSSAGASIQARYLARSTPINNFKIMAFGYERGGLGFISGVAIDQHFSQRERQKDMTRLVNKYPQLLGIGIDESTAIIVQKSTAQVVGRGKVHFYDRNRPVYPNKPDYIALESGGEYDLADRKITTTPNGD